MPAWRSDSSAAAWPRVRSCSSSPASAGNAMPSPKPASSCGQQRPQRRRLRQEREARDPAGHQQAAGQRARRRRARASNEPATAASGSIVTAAAAASGSTLQPLISSSTSRKITAVSAPDSSASAAADEHVARRARQRLAHGGDRARRQRRGRRQRDRRLGDEDRAPVEQLRQDAAERGAGGGAGHGGAHPEPAARAAAVEGVEGRGQQRRGAERLERTHDQQQLERVRARAADRRGREQQRAGSAGGAVVQRGGQRQRERQHERVDADHCRDALDGRVELEQQLRQRERDDRRVRERQAGRDGDQGASHTGLSSSRTVRVPAPAPGCRPHWTAHRAGRRLTVMAQRSNTKSTDNLAARAGRWSAQHRKKAIFGWLAFVILAVFIGGSVGHADAHRRGVRHRRVRPRRQGRIGSFPRQGQRERPGPEPERGEQQESRVPARGRVGRDPLEGTKNVRNVQSPYAEGNEGTLSRGRQVRARHVRASPARKATPRTRSTPPSTPSPSSTSRRPATGSRSSATPARARR